MSSTEHFVLDRTKGGWSLVGEVVLAIHGSPGRIEYEVLTDEHWLTRSAEARITTDRQETSVIIDIEDGVWYVDGQVRRGLKGCVDVDLGWTPATNTLPLRRLGIAVGGSANVWAAWVRFPELRIEATEQQYARLTQNVWRYRSATADLQIETTPEMVVSRYGDDLWVADT